jgi:hypothetical protein
MVYQDINNKIDEFCLLFTRYITTLALTKTIP